jgi:ABC-type bacteriocin/lantibiotic exporter with double-glycine peptidase domain
MRKLKKKIIDFSEINDLNTNLSEDSFSEIEDIVFKEFSLKYFGSDFIYKVDYLKLVKGGRYLVSGDNGSGKSTILRLISGLSSPLSGELMVNGERVKAAFQWLKQNVLYLSVHDSLFKGGVEDNVTFFSEDPQDNFIACEILMALGFYDNIGGENSRFKIKLTPFGDGVSRGQKQKILIARAILKRPKILILDEVSSGMDVASEEKLLATLKRFLPNTIILYVLHKHSAQQDKFIRIEVDKGRLLHES